MLLHWAEFLATLLNHKMHEKFFSVAFIGTLTYMMHNQLLFLTFLTTIIAQTKMFRDMFISRGVKVPSTLQDRDSLLFLLGERLERTSLLCKHKWVTMLHLHAKYLHAIKFCYYLYNLYLNSDHLLFCRETAVPQSDELQRNRWINPKLALFKIKMTSAWIANCKLDADKQTVVE